MSKNVCEKEAALVSVAIATYLARRVVREEGSSNESSANHRSIEFSVLKSQIVKLEERIDRLDRAVRDLQRRMSGSEEV